MKKHLTGCTSDEAVCFKSSKGETEPVQAEAISLWRRPREKIRDWLFGAERRVTKGFRVPPNGG